MRRRIFIAVLTALAVVGVTGSAYADTTASLSDIQKVEVGTAGLDTAVWNTGSDSPNDRNSRRLHAVVGVDPDTSDTQYSYLAFYSGNSRRLRTSVEDVKNLSFEFSEGGHVGAGAPRISVQVAGGDLLYLSAFYCNHTLASSGNAWGRADFTRFVNNCAIWDNNGVEYSADGTRTAVEVYAAAHPDADLASAYIVLDEEGKYNLDRISLGDGVMHTRSFKAVAACPTEGSC